MIPIEQLAPILCSQHGFIMAMYAMVLRAAFKARKIVQKRRLNGLYYSDDITVIGGAAYRLYSQQFGLAPMETRDIDMVWWASRLVRNEDIIALSQQLAIVLREVCNREDILESLRKVVAHYREQSDVPPIRIEVTEPIIRMFENTGIVKQTSMKLTIIIGKEQLTNLCDMTIHNGMNSQVQTLQAAESDPTYCDQRTHYTGTMGIIRVPLLHRFIDQQLFAHMMLSYAHSDLPRAERQSRAEKCMQRVLHFGVISIEYARGVVDTCITMYIYSILSSACDRDAFIERLESSLQEIPLPQAQQTIRAYRTIQQTK